MNSRQISRLFFLTGVLITALVVLVLQHENVDSGAEPDIDASFRVVTLVDDLTHPWSMAFLPDGRMLVTERPGRLRIIANGRLLPAPVEGMPEIAAKGQGGLLDVVLHPNFKENRWVYLSYAAGNGDGIGTEVGRGRLQGNRITEWQRLFRLLPKSGTGRHFGSRLVFDNDGYLFITLGDRGERHRAQDSDDHAGSVIRLHEDGRIPEDNPFVGRPGVKPEIYSIGHRNMQGAALHPETGTLWVHEHGPQGGDELNIIRPGRNYGWPVITYGKEYGTGFDIGEGTEKPGMEQPIHYWVPSIAPSGMAFYTGDKFPDWRGDLFIGALKFQLLARLELEGGKVIVEERLLKDKLGRIRDVRMGPDGYIYLLTDALNGKLVRLEPRP
jgi:glucose/arabinose dehydrogenase